MSNILCLETSIGKCSVALMSNSCEDYIEAEDHFVQSEKLFVLITQLLKRNNISFKDLDIIACTLGPGSFTGIRIGIAAVQGMHKVLTQVKLLAVSSLEVMVSSLNFPASGAQKILPVLNASSGELYTQEFDLYGNALSPIFVFSQQELEQNLSNSLLVTEQSSFKHPQGYPVEITAKNLLKKIKQIISQGQESEYSKLEPLYIKEPNITYAAAS